MTVIASVLTIANGFHFSGKSDVKGHRHLNFRSHAYYGPKHAILLGLRIRSYPYEVKDKPSIVLDRIFHNAEGV